MINVATLSEKVIIKVQRIRVTEIVSEISSVERVIQKVMSPDSYFFTDVLDNRRGHQSKDHFSLLRCQTHSEFKPMASLRAHII